MEFTTEFGKRILNDYASFLNAVQMPVDSAGLTYVEEAGAMLPMTIKSRRLVLPTNDWLRDPNWEQTIPFHPFSEHLSKGKSIVLERTVRITVASINRMLSELLMTMAVFSVDSDRHAEASANAKGYLRLIPEVNKKFVTDVRSFLQKHVDDTAERSLLSLFLKRGESLRGTKYDRVAIVASPAFKAISSEEAEVFGYKFSSKKNREYLQTLMLHLLPGIDTADTYSVGTNSPVAPYFISLLTAFRGIREALWPHLEAMAEVNPDLNKYLTDNTWVDMLENAAEVSKEIHALRDNTGEDEMGDVRVQSTIVSKEREREEARERREKARSGRNVYADRLAASRDERRDDRHDDRRDDRDDREEERGGWRRLSRRRDDRYDDRRDRYEDDRYDDRRRGRDRYDDRDDRDRYDDRYDDRRRSRGRDRYDEDDRDGYTPSGIPLDAGRPRRGRY